MRKAVMTALNILLAAMTGLFVNFCGYGTCPSPTPQQGQPSSSFDIALVKKTSTPAPTPSPTLKPTPQPTPDPLRQRIQAMTTEEKIGQLVIAGIDGTALDENGMALIGQYRVGGVILYGSNIIDPAQLTSLLNSLKTANKGSVAPLLLCVDQEGGRIDRMPPALHRLPTAQAVGGLGKEELAFHMYKAIAGEIRAFGFNLDFAPVLDVNSNPDNPVIGNRSFGATADTVGKMGIQAMKGLMSGGVIPVIKHFPGHGDTAVDSHIGLPVMNHSLDSLRRRELIPFAYAISEGAEAVLMAHILLPEIDRDNPSSFSRTIITGVLRGELGFDGVVITDDMTMGAIVQNYDIAESAVKAILAGSDIVLVAHDFELETKVINGLRQAAAAGVLTSERIDESVCRILKLKERYLLSDEQVAAADVDAINRNIEKAVAGIPMPTPTATAKP